jgi:membrane-associated phospholipid phosphatase
VLLFVGVLVPLVAFGVLAAVATAGKPDGWDADAVQLAERHYRVSAIEWTDRLLTGGVGLAGVLAAGAVIGFLLARKVRYAVFWALGVGGLFAVDAPLKAAFHRPAFEGGAGDYSFPSGGALVSLGFLLTLALTLSVRWRRPLLVLGVPSVFGYGGALVYSWWHYPSDVLAGWCLSLAWVVGLWLVLLRGRAGSADRRG